MKDLSLKPQAKKLLHTSYANNKPLFAKYSSDIKDIQMGYGACKACNCKGYISKHNNSHECKVCSHHFDRHYSA